MTAAEFIAKWGPGGLDAAVAAYGWHDYRADLPDDEILRRLLALNLRRAQPLET